jgi:hypothetical protein
VKTKKFDDILIKVRRGAWRTTICRLIRAEQEAERATILMNAATDAGTTILRDNERLQAEGLADARTIGKLEADLCMAVDAAKVSMQIAEEAGIARGREEVLQLIARWGKCRPLEGLNGEQMSEALRKVLTPTIASYTDYKGATEAIQDGTFDPTSEIPGETEPRISGPKK